MNVGRVLSETARKRPHKIAIIFRDEHITFSALDLMATRLANKLRGFEITKGDRVAIILPNSSQFAVAYFAVLKLGAVGVPLDFRLKGEEIHPILIDAEVKAAITSSHYQSASMFSEAKGIAGVIATGERINDKVTQYEEVVGDASLSSELMVDTEEEEDALYLYTSGTTGAPKAVVLAFSHLDLFPEVLTMFCKTSENDVLGCPLPMSHISGPIVCNETAVRGSTLCIFDQLRPDKILAAMEKHRVTYFFGVPPIYEAILHVPHRERYNLSSLRFVSMMGTSISLELLKSFKKEFPSVAVIQGYGLTETSPQVTLMPLEYEEKKRGSIGIAVPHAQIKIVDEEGKEVPGDEVGELIVTGPMVMKGYHNNPEATRERIKDGWLYTGDLCKKDRDGFYYHLGRKDDMIIVGGLNVYPAEVEQVLKEHPLIKEAGVVGITDEDRGATIKAAVVIQPDSQITKREIISFCKQKLARFKVPKVIEFWDALPKSSTGKIARKQLIDQKKFLTSSSTG
jgi:long-chain acyl-CoA synthetase